MMDDLMADIDVVMGKLKNMPHRPREIIVSPRVFEAARRIGKRDGIEPWLWLRLHWPHDAYLLRPFMESAQGTPPQP